MKTLMHACLLVALLAAPAVASAQSLLFGYQARVVYTTGLSYGIYTLTLPECDQQFQTAFGNGSNIDLAQTYYCKPVFKHLPLLVEKFDWNLGCVVCGVLDDATVHRVYPDHAEQVLQLKQEFDIDGYISGLQSLQRAHDLEGFQQRMGELEQSMLR